MEFSFNIEKTLSSTYENGVAFIDGSSPNKYSHQDFSNISNLIDIIGQLSSKVIHKIIIIFKIL